eukprot:124594-Chlamydomonas_euryale.AAC.7
MVRMQVEVVGVQSDCKCDAAVGESVKHVQIRRKYIASMASRHPGLPKPISMHGHGNGQIVP